MISIIRKNKREAYGPEREEMTMKRNNKKEEVVYKDNPVDQANLDIHFVEAFVDLLFHTSCEENFDALKGSTISALCYDCTFKLDRLKKFLAGLPIDAGQQLRTSPEVIKHK